MTNLTTQAPSILNLSNWLQDKGGAALDFLVRAAFAALLFFIITKILKKICKWLENHLAKTKMDPSVRSFVVSLLHYGVLTLTVITIIIQLRIVEVTSIAALLASAGIGISLAMQGTLSNFAGGMLLLIMRPFAVGDYVSVPAADVEGFVDRIDLYYTRIKTIENQMISVPNSLLTNNSVRNLTGDARRKLNILVSIAYDADIRKAKGILEKLVADDPLVIQEGCQIFVAELGESAVKLGLRAWVRTDDYYPALWGMNEKIKLAFDEAGVKIPFNQMDVHIKKD